MVNKNTSGSLWVILRGIQTLATCCMAIRQCIEHIYGLGQSFYQLARRRTLKFKLIEHRGISDTNLFTMNHKSNAENSITRNGHDTNHLSNSNQDLIALSLV